MFVALGLIVVLVLLSGFQLALAAGAPWGKFAWGDQHLVVLPLSFRIGFLISATLYADMVLVPLSNLRASPTCLHVQDYDNEKHTFRCILQTSPNRELFGGRRSTVSFQP